MNRLLLVVAVLWLAGCASMTKVGPGEVLIRERVTAVLDSAWNRFDGPGAGKGEVWTIDGLPLDRLVFYVGVKDGEPIAELPARKDRQVPKFRSGMQPHDVVDMYEVFATHDGSVFQRGRLAPAQFGGGEGFRFEFTRVRKGDELDLKGVAYGVVRGGELFLMVFEAPQIHYFGKHAGRVEAVARSLKIRG